MSKKLEPQTYIHGSKLKNKLGKDRALQGAFDAYETWRDQSLAIIGRSKTDIAKLTRLLNDYKDVSEPIFDGRPNSAQEVLQPSILEEFFEYLFCRVSTEIGLEPLRRPSSGYIGLVFNPKSLGSLLKAPEYTIRKKDHDFVIGAHLEIAIGAKDSEEEVRDDLVVPAIAIECKRYLERNMLDECAGTAEKIKKATPYCKYLIVAEFLKMDDASPEVSLIDEIYVIRKQRNSDRLADGFRPNPIYDDLICEIYDHCLSHLKKIWWDPNSGITTGKMFNFPR
jgi:hypothetical protein